MISSDENSAANRFRTTHWSLTAAAREGATPQAQAALASLCKAYWLPLYAFIRRQGYAIEDARDLTQEFFAHFLEKDYLGEVDREKGVYCGCPQLSSSEWAGETLSSERLTRQAVRRPQKRASRLSAPSACKVEVKSNGA